MKLEIGKEEVASWVMTLIPETPEEKQALHDITYRGIHHTDLLGLQTAQHSMALNLGPDYITQHRIRQEAVAAGQCPACLRVTRLSAP